MQELEAMCASCIWEETEGLSLLWDANAAHLTTASTAELFTAQGKSGELESSF